MNKITVLIVDDSALIRKLFREMLSNAADIEVLDTAVDANDAREKIKRLNPQVITLDIEMPGMNGLMFLEKIMTLRPMPVIMVSTLTQKGASETIRALEIGAFDYISKPVTSQTHDSLALLKEELVSKVRVAAAANVVSRARNIGTAAQNKIIQYHPKESRKSSVIAIGSSTGGGRSIAGYISNSSFQLPSGCHYTTYAGAFYDLLCKAAG